MKNISIVLLVSLVFLLFFSPSLDAQTDKKIPDFSSTVRKDIPDEYKWRITDIYANIEAWNAEKDRLKKLITELDQYIPKATESAKNLLTFESKKGEIIYGAVRMLKYADLCKDMELDNQQYSTMQREAWGLFSQTRRKSRPVTDGIINLGKKGIEQFISEEPGLEAYRKDYLDHVRWSVKAVSKDKQEIINLYAPLNINTTRMAKAFKEREMPKAKITLSDGVEHTLDYPTFINLSNRGTVADKQALAKAFYENLGKYQTTFAGLLELHMKMNVARARAEGFDTFLDMKYFSLNIDPAVYKKVIEKVRENLGILHRYLDLKRRILGLETLNTSNSFSPAVADLDRLFSYEEARHMVLESSKRAGNEFFTVMQKSFNEGWIDRYPHKMKKSFGYASQVYGVHPYVLLNFTGDFHDIYVMTHELGHAVNMWLSEKKQHVNNSGVQSIPTEAAAMVNEQLLVDYLMGTDSDDRFKLFILEKNVKGIINGMFFQTMNSEFELRSYEHAEKGQALSAQWLNDTFLRIEREYYGHDKGICTVNDHRQHRWMEIEHYYYDYYLMNYSFGKIAALALFNMIDNGGAEAQAKYINFLSSGSSVYPIDTLKNAGVDLEDDAVYDAAFSELDGLIDRMEITAKKIGLIK